MENRIEGMITGSGERAQMMMRQVRVSRLRYYLLAAIFIAIVTFLQIKPDVMPVYLILDMWPLDQILKIVLLFLALVLILTVEMKRMMQLYIVTNIRVIEQSGLLNKNTVVMMIEKVQQVYGSQSFLQRIFRYGDVVVDTGEDSMILASVSHPTLVEGAITEAMARRRIPP